MFDELIKQLNKLDKQQISVPIDSDEKGYIDRQCPSNTCEFFFKVNESDWLNIFKDEAVWCPFCRHEAPSDQWFTNAQIEHATSESLALLQGKINNAMRSDARKFNQKQPKNSFMSMSMEVKGGSKKTHVIPAKSAELMQLEITCEECSSRFAVIGSAYFCPACGHNSVLRTFSDSLNKIKAKKDCINTVKIAITESTGKDDAENTCRSMIESCIQDGVVAFQKYCEGMYEPFGKTNMNTFQRLDQGSKFWNKAVGKGYEDWVSKRQFDMLVLLFQKRHILAHNHGIVDSTYINKSKDPSYKEGQRIVITGSDVDTLITIIDKLGKEIKKACDINA